jgi:hypothetical protein
VGDLNLRPGPITREIIGRIQAGVIDWEDGPNGIIRVNKAKMEEIWNIDLEGVLTILMSEWRLVEESPTEVLLRHETLKEGMLLEDWDVVRKSILPRSKVWVKDNQLHMIFLTRSASIETVAAQISDQLGYMVLPENIRNPDGSLWEGQWYQSQTLLIQGFWRWQEEVRGEKFNINPMSAWRDTCEQLRRLGLEPGNYEEPIHAETGITIRLNQAASSSRHESEDGASGGGGVRIPARGRGSEPDFEAEIKTSETHYKKRKCKVVIKGQTYRVTDPQADIFSEVMLKVGEQKGWLLSEEFKGNETQEIITQGPFQAKGTWYWLNLSEWREAKAAKVDKFSILIGDRRINFSQERPDSFDSAEEIFWNSTGLTKELWEIRWAGKGMTGRLRRMVKASKVKTPPQKVIHRILTAHLLPETICLPAAGSFIEVFEHLTSLPIHAARFWWKGDRINPGEVCPLQEIAIEYLPMSKGSKRALTLIWPGKVEHWLISTANFVTEILKILRTLKMSLTTFLRKLTLQNQKS